MAPLKVLFVAPSLVTGGAEKHLVRLVRHLDRERFEVSVAVAAGGGALEDELPDDVPRFVLRPGRPWSAVVRMLRSVRPLRELIESRRPDVVCGVGDAAGVLALLAARRLADPKVVVSVQNALSRKYETRHPTRLFLWRRMRRLYPRADRLVASSEGVAADVTRAIGCPAEKVEVIYNAGWVPEEPGSERGSRGEGLGGGGWRVVACGRLVEQKGFDLLLDAMASLRRTLSAKLSILGEGPRRRSLERQVRRLGLGEHVRLPGVHPDPMAVMAQADLFVLSSRWEGFANVVVEAMASGTPVVATDCPHGPGEIVEDGVSGLLVPPGRSDRLAVAMARVLGDPDLARRLAAGGRERARTFSSEVAARRYGELFERLCGRSTG